MIRVLGCLLLALATSCASTSHQAESAAGALIVVGGGGTPKEVVEKAVELGGGPAAVVAVLPHASSSEERGIGSAEMFLEAGASEAYVMEDLESAEMRAFLERATLVWMPGGDQSLIMEATNAAGLTDELRAMHRRGIPFGGTSAGAAVQSGLMITGNAELEAVLAQTTELVEGLDLWDEVIVDQHFLARRRFHRLLSATLDHPDKLGVGIDERTAVIVQDHRFEVMGENSVLVIDAREAEVAATEPGKPSAATGMRLHLLRAGMSYELPR